MPRTVLWFRVMVEFESDATMDEHDVQVATDTVEGAIIEAQQAEDFDPEHYSIQAVHVTVDMTSSEAISE